MLISQEWSTPKAVEPGKNIRLRFSQGAFTVKVYNQRGVIMQREIPDGREYLITATEIQDIEQPLISFKSHTSRDTHVNIEYQ